MKKWQVNKTIFKLKFNKSSNNKKYKSEKICDNIVYNKKLKSGHLPGFYYLVL